MVKIVKKKNESVERLISKFNKLFQRSRKSILVQTKRYHRDKDSKRKRRIKAVKREENRARRAKMQFR